MEVKGAYGDKLAFRNPNDEIVPILQNSAAVALTPTINLGGRQFAPTLAPYSWNTFTLAAAHS